MGAAQQRAHALRTCRARQGVPDCAEESPTDHARMLATQRVIRRLSALQLLTMTATTLMALAYAGVRLIARAGLRLIACAGVRLIARAGEWTAQPKENIRKSNAHWQQKRRR
jgi:hypothetical protein